MADHFKRPRYTTAEEAVSCIRTGDRVFVHSVSMAPHTLINAMIGRADELRDVEVIHIHTEGPAPYTNPDLAKSFRHNACFVGSNARKAVQQGDADYLHLKSMLWTPCSFLLLSVY